MLIDRWHINIALIGVILLGAAGIANSEERPIYAEASKDHMSMSVKVSRTGIIEAHRKATIKQQEGSSRHVFWFALLDKNDNTLWVAPVETLTVVAKVHSGIKHFGEPIDSSRVVTAHYEAGRDIAKRTRGALVFMKQESSDDDLLKRVEEAVGEFKRVDNAYKKQKSSVIVKDGQKVVTSAK